MKPEPLKGKRCNVNELPNRKREGNYRVFFPSDITSAVEWLKREINTIEFKHDKILPLGYVNRKIKKAFEDVVK